MLAQQLAHARHLRVLSDDQNSGFGNLALQPALARALAARAGARFVVFASLHRLADSYHLDIEVERVANRDAGMQHWEWEQVTIDPARLNTIMANASVWMDRVAATAPTPDPPGSRP